MSENLFQKVAVFTDSHYGRSGGSVVALQDELDFLDWAIDRAKSWGAEKCIFMGDFFDNRNSIGVITLNYALTALEKLNKAFEINYFLLGNHDLPYRYNRSSSSLEVARNFPNIHIIRDPTEVNGVTFLPWLIENEYKNIGDIKTRYAFGHLEMGGFRMNSQVILPDADHLIKPDQFKNVSELYVGHFHARQTQYYNKGQSRITYIGSTMPFNFSDVNDTERGMMLLEWGKEPIMETWPDQPLYGRMNLSTLMLDESKYLKPKMSIKVEDDLNMSYEESQELKELLCKTYSLRKFELTPANVEEKEQEFSDDVEFKDVDQMVIEGLLSVDSVGLNTNKLVSIYGNLKL